MSFPQSFCARHGSRVSRETEIKQLNLCDQCAQELITKAFNGNPPIKIGEEIQAQCQFCLEEKLVKPRSWQLCTICSRVVEGYGISKAGMKYLLKKLPRHQDIELKITDPVKPMSYKQHQKASRSKKVEPDLAGIYRKNDQRLFLIEIKTGPSAIQDMKEFQLDIGDCKHILRFFKRYKLPTYVFHIQVVKEQETIIPKDAWWVDVFEMHKYCKDIRIRPREYRAAAYYEPRMFRHISEFPVEPKFFLEKVKRVKQEVPRLIAIRDNPRVKG
ncbi:MAG: hypothetical protein DRO98_08300 [Archaeoglobales archaeon]|nr:MAG: hypothetical protein DRO98_08300 [Archaeoglobales archaeon]